MTYYNVKIVHKQHPEDGALNVQVLGNNVIEVNDTIIAMLRDAGEDYEQYSLTISEAINEKDLSKAVKEDNSSEGN